MSKLIYVQAKSDHIASLAKATPLAAVEELIWNALDADAREVRVDVLTNALGAAEGVRVSDNGTGIDVLRADSTFGSLGGSWKRGATGTDTARRLHGRHGRGRFKAFALGTHAEWRTTMRAGEELLSYTISGDVQNPGVFEISAAPNPGPGTGTEVFVSNAGVNCDSLLNAVETVQALSAKFALYLKSYPDIRIYFNGLPVTPIIVQRNVTDIDLKVGGGAKARLEIIEWKRRFAGAGRLVFAGPDGFELHSQPCGIRAGGIPYTAYIVSPRFTALNAENALVMDELNAEVRMYIDAAKEAIKTHFAKLVTDRGAAAVETWMNEGSYPFEMDDSEDEKTRTRFNKLAIELSERLESFRELSSDDRALVFRLLRHAMNDVKRGGLKELLA